MKILHFSDYHISVNKFIPVQEFIDILDMVYKSALDNECKCIIFSGDFFDKKNNPRWLYDCVVEKLIQLDEIDWYLGVGNHDRDSEGHSLEIFKILSDRIPHINILDLPATLGLAEDSKTYKIRVVHGIGPGSTLDNGYEAKQEMIDLSDEDIYSDGDIDYICAGHLHTHQKFNIGKFGYYAGSPLQLNFGESGQNKGWLVIDLEKKKKKFIRNKTSIEHLVIDVNMEDPDIKNHLKTRIESNCCIKFRVSGSPRDILDFKTKYARKIANKRKYIVESIITKLNYSSKIVEITQTSTLDSDVDSYLDSVDLSDGIVKSVVSNRLKKYIERAREYV